uniref:Uncharacterized protein n=1 Tax=Clytia hemisphaerica TaxID=252671 RepID=A0A7M5X7D1_9CNID
MKSSFTLYFSLPFSMKSSFTKERDINHNQKYVIPWNEIDLDSSEATKEIDITGYEQVVCSNGKLVLVNTQEGYNRPHALDVLDLQKFRYEQDDPIQGKRKLDANDPIHQKTSEYSSFEVMAISHDLNLVAGVFWKLNLGNCSNSVFMEQYHEIHFNIFKPPSEEPWHQHSISVKGNSCQLRHLKFSQSNQLLAVIYTICRHKVCKIFRLNEEATSMRPYRTFQLEVDLNLHTAVSQTSFNRLENLFLVEYTDNGSPTAVLYNLESKKVHPLHLLSAEPSFKFIVRSFLVSTLTQDFVFFQDISELKGFEISAKDSIFTPVIKGMNILKFVEPSKKVKIIRKIEMHHYVSKIRLFLLSENKLYVICPFNEVILKSFNYDPLNEISLFVNWSGEEIFVYEGYNKLLVFDFVEDKEKHTTLTNLARRSIFANFSESWLRSMDLPSPLERLLGLM